MFNLFFYQLFFIFNVSILKININLMFFKVKRIFKTHLEVEAITPCMFESVVNIVFQSVFFLLEIHQNNIFIIIIKIYF